MWSLGGWFKGKFVYAFIVQVSRLPRVIPDGALVRAIGKSEWKYSIYCDSPEIFDALIVALVSEQLSYTADAHAKSGLLSELVQCPGSLTRLLWKGALGILGIVGLSLLPGGVYHSAKSIFSWREWTSGLDGLLQDLKEAIRI